MRAMSVTIERSRNVARNTSWQSSQPLSLYGVEVFGGRMTIFLANTVVNRYISTADEAEGDESEEDEDVEEEEEEDDGEDADEAEANGKHTFPPSRGFAPNSRYRSLCPSNPNTTPCVREDPFMPFTSFWVLTNHSRSRASCEEA